jgi:superfamily II DNA or RNA helicase
LELRKDQKVAFTQYVLKNKYRDNGVIQMPTGKGKSILGLMIAKHLGQKTLILVHKNDLVIGWQKDIEKSFDGALESGLIKAQVNKIGKQITITTVQTLSKMLAEMSAFDKKAFVSQFGLVICDEVHHSPCAMFSVLDDFPSKYRLGLSATPERDDGLTPVIGFYFGDTCYQYKSAEGDTDIQSVAVIRKNSDVFYNPVYRADRDGSYVVSDDFAPRAYVPAKGQIRISDIPYENRPKLKYLDVENVVLSDKGYRQMVINDIVAEVGRGHSCVAFFTQRDYAVLYNDILRERGVVSQTYFGGETDDEEKLRRAEDREVMVTCTTLAKSTEGTNVKAWEVAFLVSSISSEKNLEQACGRIRRVKQGKMSPSLVYDYRHPDVYTMKSHGNNRDSRYRQLGFEFLDKTKTNKLFSRGYKE